MMEKDEEILHEFGEMVQLATSEWGRQQQYLQNAWLFASGKQYSDQEERERASNKRPKLEVLNVVRPRLNRVLNPFRASPNGMYIKHRDSSVQSQFNKLLAEIQRDSSADEVFECAMENQLVGGVGYWVVTTDYQSPETLNQCIKLIKIDNPNSVYIDPTDLSIDGSEARWGYIIDYTANEVIEELYGEEYECKESQAKQGYYKHIVVPKDTTPVVTLYVREKKMVKRWFFADGSYVDQYNKPELETIGKRMVELNWINVYKIIGQKIVDKTKMELDRVPIVRVVGDTQRKGDGVRWVGLVEAMVTPQRMANTYINSEKEMVENAPISPFLATVGQVKGLEDYWKRANKTAFDTLLYNKEDGTGAPQRMNNTANIQPTIMGRQQAMADLDQSTGIYQNQMGDTSGIGDESGTSIRLRNSIGEIQWKHYYQNMNKSIESTIKICLQLIPIIYDYDLDLDGEIVNFGGYKLDKYSVEASIGAMNESQKERNLSNLMVITSMLPEDRKTAFLDIMASMIESDKKSLIESRIAKLIPADLREDAEQQLDPMAQQALDSAMQASQELQAQNDLMKQYIAQLQNQLVAMENDSQTALLQTQLNNENKLQVEAMKQEGLNQRQIAQMIEEATKRQEEKIDKILESLAKPIQAEEYNPENIKSDLIGKQFG